MKRILLQILLLVLATNLEAQTFIGPVTGTSISGGNDDVLGFTVSLSSNGNRIAAGAPYNTVSTINGYARVYDKGTTSCTQTGNTMTGEASGDNFGRIAISGNGNRLAVGGSANDGNGADSGHVRVFNWSGSAWVQLGTDINGEAAGDNSGVRVSLSNDGTVVAIGAHLNDGNGASSGHVRVYAWNGSAWVQRGADLNGEAAGDEFGAALALSLDGTKLAVGARKNDGSGVDAGHVRVFNWNGSAWAQMGADINGEAAGDLFGISVGISNTGTRLVVGASLADTTTLTNCGHVRVYNFNGTSWAQLGSDIDGTQNGANFGNSVSMDGTGNAVVAGAPGYDYSISDTNTGMAKYLKWNGTTWNQVGNSILGYFGLTEQLGYAVALSNDGNTVALGAPFSTVRGFVQVYDFTAALSTNDFVLNNKFQFYPNPAQSSFSIHSEVEIEKVEIYSLQGQLVKSFNQQDKYYIDDLAAGIYSVVVVSNEGKGVKKLIKQ